MTEFFERLKREDLHGYAPIPFWSWNNLLDRDELLKQIGEMQSIGCGGFIMHARTGLKTEYLSEEWFSLIESCLDAAKQRGMNAWIYDENGWPSGFAGGKLLKKGNYAQYLELKEGNFDPEAYAVFFREGTRFSRALSPENGVHYYNVMRRESPSNTDILDPAVVEQFLACTHEEYYRRFKDRFGKELVGFFTDEPQFFRTRTPYSPVAEEAWKKRFGGELKDGIISLFFDGEEHYPFRVRYYSLMHELYVENYYRRLFEWCEAHGCMLTGHSIEENYLYTQMWGSAGVASSYEYEHIPGIDNLTLYGPARLSARQAGSAAGQLGKRQILTETFGASGYAATPAKLKAAAEKQYVHGVNLMCHHLFAYSLAGQGKTDHPPCFSRHCTWWKELGAFNTYFTRLGFLLAESESQVNCVVINPMSSVYLHYDHLDESAAMETDRKLGELMDTLNRNCILYDFADERILERHGSVRGKELAIGARSYRYVIVPDCENLSAPTKRVLKEYAAAGGAILAAGVPGFTDGVRDDWSFLRSNVSFGQIAEGGGIRLASDGSVEYTYRNFDGIPFLYAVNLSDKKTALFLPPEFARADLMAMRLTECGGHVTLNAGEGALFVLGEGESAPQFGRETEIPLSFLSADDNNLTLDAVRVSYDGVHYGTEEPLAEAFDRLLREEYRGKLFLSFGFHVKSKPKKLYLRREKGKYTSSLLNGVPLSFEESGFDVFFEEADLAAAVREGRNEYVCSLDFYEQPQVFYALFSPEATESMRNCLAYDTELENVYLRGEFSVDGDRDLCPPVNPSAAHIEAQGYPYFAGEVKFGARVRTEKGLARLVLTGNFAAAELYADGKFAGFCFEGGEIVFPTEEGETGLTVVLSSTLRNLFGPFHWKGGEEAIGPFHFTMRGAWKDGKCEYFTPEYRIVPFGIESAKLSFAKETGK